MSFRAGEFAQVLIDAAMESRSDPVELRTLEPGDWFIYHTAGDPELERKLDRVVLMLLEKHTHFRYPTVVVLCPDGGPRHGHIQNSQASTLVHKVTV